MSTPTRFALLVALAAVTATALAQVSATVSPDAALTAAQRVEPFRFGRGISTISDINDPAGVAVGPDGGIRVVERNLNRILTYRREGNTVSLVSSVGTLGDGPGAFRRPRGIAIAPDGRILVADTGNDRVQILDASGGPIAIIGSRGTGIGQFNAPTGIAADADGIGVVDTGNNRVQLFDREGRFLRVIGGPASTEGQLNHPLAVAFDERGRVIVADSGNNRICIYDRSGAFVTSWGDYGPQAGMLDRPSDVACYAGQVFVVDSRNHRIQVFDGSGALIRDWGRHARRPREGDGRIHDPACLAFAPDGAFAVIGEPFEDRVQVFAAAAPDELEAPREGIPPGEQTHFGKRFATDGDLLVVPEPEYHRVLVFDLSNEAPVLVGQFGSRGEGFGQFLWPTGVVVDAGRRRAVVADRATGRLQVFEINHTPGEPLRFDPERARFVFAVHPAEVAKARFSRAKWPINADGLATDPAGNVILLDTTNDTIFLFDPELDPVVAYGGHGDNVGQLRTPTAMAPNRLGDGYFIVDSGHHRVLHIDRRGVERVAFGSYGDEPGSFINPTGIAAGHDGFVYVVDEGRDRVLKFNEAGRFIQEWGTRGVDHGAFWNPSDIVQDARGRIIVLDHGNHRAQVFEPDGGWVATFGSGRVTTRSSRPSTAGEGGPDPVPSTAPAPVSKSEN